MLKKYLLCTLLITFACSFSGELSAKNYYRYTNSDGQLVVKDVLPNEALSLGYEIINEQGRILETVAPLLTLEEKLAEQEKQQKLAELAQKQKLAKTRDRQLLRQYNSADDIERSEKNQSSSLRINMDIITRHTKSLKNKKEELQSRSANYERRGTAIPESILREMASVDKQIATNEASLIKYEQQIKSIHEQYRNDLIRFKELKAEQFILRSQNTLGTDDDSLIYQCDDKVSCDKNWKFAQIFAHEHGTSKLEMVTDTIILTGKPRAEDHISLSITRLPNDDDSMNIVLEVKCFPSGQGDKLCASDAVMAIKEQFIDYLSEND